MMIKKIAAFALAAGVLPFSAGSFPAPQPLAVYAKSEDAAAALPDWVPTDFSSALDFRNTYGTTHIEDGLLCIVYREDKECERGSGSKNEPHYQIKSTEGIMEKVADETYSSEQCRCDYEVVVYSPQKAGDFEVALIDNWVKSSSLEPELGYVHYVEYHTFSVGDDRNITETDRFSWIPDCITEYNDYLKENDLVSVKDNFIVFCLDSAVGTQYTWQQMSTGFSDNAELYEVCDCSTEYDIPPVGGTSHIIKIFQATKDGNVQIGFEYSKYLVVDEPGKGEKTLLADCAILDGAQTVLLPGNMRVTLADSDTGKPIPFDDDTMTSLWTNVSYNTEQGTVSTGPLCLLMKNPTTLNSISKFFEADDFSFGLVRNSLPEGYALPSGDCGCYNGASVPDGHVDVKRYENGSADVVFMLKKSAVPNSGQVRVTLKDKDTGELISDELLKDEPFRFQQMTHSNGYGEVIYVDTNPCILNNDISLSLDEKDIIEFWNDHNADQPDITVSDNGSVELTFSYRNSVEGDVNGDGILSVSDAVLLQRWLLGAPRAELKRWELGDLCKDGVLDSFDLCLMKKSLIQDMKMPVSLDIIISGGIAGIIDEWKAYEEDGSYYISYQDKRRTEEPVIVRIPEEKYRYIMSLDYDKIMNDEKKNPNEIICDGFDCYSVIIYEDGSEVKTSAYMGHVTASMRDIMNKYAEQENTAPDTAQS